MPFVVYDCRYSLPHREIVGLRQALREAAGGNLSAAGIHRPGTTAHRSAQYLASSAKRLSSACPPACRRIPTTLCRRPSPNSIRLPRAFTAVTGCSSTLDRSFTAIWSVRLPPLSVQGFLSTTVHRESVLYASSGAGCVGTDFLYRIESGFGSGICPLL